jgi:hypothetical protein
MLHLFKVFYTSISLFLSVLVFAFTVCEISIDLEFFQFTDFLLSSCYSRDKPIEVTTITTLFLYFSFSSLFPSLFLLHLTFQYFRVLEFLFYITYWFCLLPTFSIEVINILTILISISLSDIFSIYTYLSLVLMVVSWLYFFLCFAKFLLVAVHVW